MTVARDYDFIIIIIAAAIIDSYIMFIVVTIMLSYSSES